MFTEKEIALADYNKVLNAYRDLATFTAGGAPINLNTIRQYNGFESNPEFDKLVGGATPAEKPNAEYREKRREIRKSLDKDGWPEEALVKVYPDLGFGSEEERAEDYQK